MDKKYLIALLSLSLLTPAACEADAVDLALTLLEKSLSSASTSGATATSVFVPAVGTVGQSFSGSASSYAVVDVGQNSSSNASAQATWDIQFLVTQPDLAFIAVTYSYADFFNTHTNWDANGSSSGNVQLTTFTSFTDAVGGTCDTSYFNSCSRSDAHAGTFTWFIYGPAKFSIIDLRGQVSSAASVNSAGLSNANGDGGASVNYSITAVAPEPSAISLIVAGLFPLVVCIPAETVWRWWIKAIAPRHPSSHSI